ncbi:hypothetical protein STEG23_015674 [Scotinomys teguina]
MLFISRGLLSDKQAYQKTSKATVPPPPSCRILWHYRQSPDIQAQPTWNGQPPCPCRSRIKLTDTYREGTQMLPTAHLYAELAIIQNFDRKEPVFAIY